MKVLAALTSAALLVPSLPVSAADLGPDGKSVLVQFADLNLDTPQGAATLIRRIQRAAEKVCAPRSAALAARERTRACIKFAVANAVATVARPAVSQYLAVTYGEPEVGSLKSASARQVAATSAE